MWCHDHCGVLVHTEDGRLVEIEEDPSCPTAGTTFPPVKGCLRLQAAKDWMYHPDRLNFPLKRAGEKGEGKWQQIPWGQALDEIADKLDKIRQGYGPEALALTAGTFRTRGDLQARFMHLFGSPNYGGAPRICWSPDIVVGATVFGWPLRSPTLAAREGLTKCFLAVGIDPSQSNARLWKSLRDGKKSGVKVIVIDPRETPAALLADLWLQLRPGTDTALLMSMINIIIEEGLYDREFVDEWCFGFDKLAERASEYPPDKVSEITWVPAEQIREAARMYATSRPAVSVNGMGVEHHSNSIEALQAKHILTAITGNIDIEGGNYMPTPAKCRVEPDTELSELLTPEQKAKQLGSGRFKVDAWPGHDLLLQYLKPLWGKSYYQARSVATAHMPSVYRAMLTGKPYPVKAAITVASNPMVTQGNVKLVYQALKSLELYTVWDYFMTPSAELADYVLPVASWLERPCLWTGSGRDNRISSGEQPLPAAIPEEYDRKSDYDILRELGIRLGQADYWPWENMEQLFDYQLEPLGLTFEGFVAKGGYDAPPNEYRKYQKMGFATPSGKVELYSTVFEKLGYDPLPNYEETAENPVSTPELAKEYPLMLITGGRFLPLYHSEYRQVDSLRRRHPHPLVQINPETARELDIRDGDWVWIESPRGRIRMKCRLFDGIDARVVHAEHGWWFPELPGEEPWLHGVWESNVNVLTNDDPDACNKLSGGWPLKTALCNIYRCKVY